MKIFVPKIVENIDNIKLTTKINKNIAVVFIIFLLNKSFNEINNAVSGFLLLKNKAGIFRNKM